MTNTMSIDSLKGVQRDLGLCDVHLAHVGAKGFTLAHTDDERASGEPLEDCDLHCWMVERDEPPAEVGLVYVVIPHEPDAYSEPYGAERWDFIRVDAFNQEQRDDG